MMTASALRRDQHNGVYEFPDEVEQLATYFGPSNQQSYVRAYPAVNKNVPLYIYKEEHFYSLLDMHGHMTVGYLVRNKWLTVLPHLGIRKRHCVDLFLMHLLSSYQYQVHVPILNQQFGTMETVFPNRVDLGLGRAPGTDMMTASALRRDQHNGVYEFPDEVELLMHLLSSYQYQVHVPILNQHGWEKLFP